jgi:RNA polymerase sigma factor (sigma-70 family)
MNYEVNNNAQLWDSFRNGDDHALTCIYNAHIQALFKYGSKLSMDESFVKDCIQDLFADLIHHRTTIGSTDNIRLYLIRSLRHKMLRNLKKHKTDLLDDYPFLLESAFDEQLHDQATKQSQRRRLREALDNLPERQKEAVYLRYIMDFENGEIAKIMDISYQAVRNTLFKAIDHLRKNLSKEELILFAMIFKKLHIKP